MIWLKAENTHQAFDSVWAQPRCMGTVPKHFLILCPKLIPGASQEPRRALAPREGPGRGGCGLNSDLLWAEPEPGQRTSHSHSRPQGYGVCSVGLEHLAYLLMAYSLGASASSLLGLTGLWLPRHVPLVSGSGLHLLLTVGLFFWAPKPKVLQHMWILYVAAVLWGVGSALNKTGLSSEYGHGPWGGRTEDPVVTLGCLRAARTSPGQMWGPVDTQEVCCGVLWPW